MTYMLTINLFVLSLFYVYIIILAVRTLKQGTKMIFSSKNNLVVV